MSPLIHVATHWFEIENIFSQEFYDVNGNSVSYIPVLPSGTSVLVYIEDSNGAEAWSDMVHILPALRFDIFPEFPHLDHDWRWRFVLPRYSYS